MFKQMKEFGSSLEQHQLAAALNGTDPYQISNFIDKHFDVVREILRALKKQRSANRAS